MHDTFYWQHGPCCAGCDWWGSYNSLAGQCTKAAPVAAEERVAMLGIHGSSLHIGAGHPFTERSHHCGDFRDSFDWSSLLPHYLRRIGAPPNPPTRRG
jgi:hypothetical protein